MDFWHAQNAEKADTCGFCLALCSFFVPCWNLYLGAKTRSAVRERDGIDGSFLGDCLCFACCTCCVLIQTNSQLNGIQMGEKMERV